MKVLFLTHRLPYAPNRGDRIRSFHLLRRLADFAEVDLLSLVHDEEEASHASDLKSLTRSVNVAPVRPLTNRVRAVLALPGRRPLTHVLLDSPQVPAALDRLTSTKTFDVVLSYCSGMAQYLFHPALRELPSVLDMVDVDSAKWSHLAKTTPLPKAWIFSREAHVLARFEARVANHVRTALTVNDREYRALSRLAPTAHIETMENGIDAGYFAPPASPASGAGVVFCGVMNYAPNEAGVQWMVEHVWPLVRRRRPDATFTIVGAHPSAKVRRLGNSTNGVVVTGAVPDVRPHLWEAAVAVAPVWVARGLQNKVLEALAAGLPCVVTPAVADGLPASMREGWRVGDDPESFADHVVALLGIAAMERRQLADRANVTSRDWSAQLRPLERILREAAATTSRIS